MRKSASQVKSLRAARRLAHVRRFALVVLWIVLPAGVLLHWSLDPLSRLAAIHGPLINLLVSVALVGLTAFYAWVTYHMAGELIDSRRAALRPLLVFSLEDPEVTDHEFARMVRISMTLTNVGRGAAIRASARGTIPYEPAGEQTQIVGDVGPSPPPIFAANASHACSWVGPLETSIDAECEDFFELDVTYEDTDGNVYQLLASYNLQIFPTFRTLRPNVEALYFLPFAKRRGLREVTAMPGDRQSALVYERVWP